MHLWSEIDSWDTGNLKPNEKKVLEAVRTVLDNSDNIEIFNKKAVYLYLREITGLNTKQVVNNLNKLRVKYRNFKSDWNKGKIKLLIAHPASCGHGLNLQAGGSLIVWLGLTWSLELYLQLNGRIARQGQQNQVRLVHIVANDTIEDRVLETLNNKDANQRETLEFFKKVIA